MFETTTASWVSASGPKASLSTRGGAVRTLATPSELDGSLTGRTLATWFRPGLLVSTVRFPQVSIRDVSTVSRDPAAKSRSGNFRPSSSPRETVSDNKRRRLSVPESARRCRPRAGRTSPPAACPLKFRRVSKNELRVFRRHRVERGLAARRLSSFFRRYFGSARNVNGVRVASRFETGEPPLFRRILFHVF